jgi:hypothetical protein
MVMESSRHLTLAQMKQTWIMIDKVGIEMAKEDK